MFKKILAATDGSDHATKAVELASELAARYGAKLVFYSMAMFRSLYRKCFR
jgi:nucleotide-binding universal stress UspA family protein